MRVQLGEEIDSRTAGGSARIEADLTRLLGERLERAERELTTRIDALIGKAETEAGSRVTEARAGLGLARRRDRGGAVGPARADRRDG